MLLNDVTSVYASTSYWVRERTSKEVVEQLNMKITLLNKQQ